MYNIIITCMYIHVYQQCPTPTHPHQSSTTTASNIISAEQSQKVHTQNHIHQHYTGVDMHTMCVYSYISQQKAHACNELLCTHNRTCAYTSLLVPTGISEDSNWPIRSQSGPYAGSI